MENIENIMQIKFHYYNIYYYKYSIRLNSNTKKKTI